MERSPSSRPCASTPFATTSATLLSPKTRLASGYRRCGTVEVSRLRFIRRAQALGVTLKEVGELLGLSMRRDVGRVKRAAEAKLADIERRMADLARVRRLADVG